MFLVFLFFLFYIQCTTLLIIYASILYDEKDKQSLVIELQITLKLRHEDIKNLYRFNNNAE